MACPVQNQMGGRVCSDAATVGMQDIMPPWTPAVLSTAASKAVDSYLALFLAWKTVNKGAMVSSL